MKMTLVFDDPSHTYYAGQNVTGRLVVTLPKATNFRAIFVQCKGDAYVSYREWVPRRNARIFGSGEKLIEYNRKLAGEQELQAGQYDYPFKFFLPPDIPSSFEGSSGRIRYRIKAGIDQPKHGKYDHVSETAITVISPLDLNTVRSAKAPGMVQVSKYFRCCCCCTSGPLELSVRLPRSGYVPGETIPFIVDIDNESKVQRFLLKCALCMEVTYTAHYPMHNRLKEIIVIADVVVSQTVQRHASKSFRRNITVPPAPPFNLDNCSIIDIEYTFTVIAMPKSCHISFNARVPITLGTVPLT